MKNALEPICTAQCDHKQFEHEDTIDRWNGHPDQRRNNNIIYRFSSSHYNRQHQASSDNRY